LQTGTNDASADCGFVWIPNSNPALCKNVVYLVPEKENDIANSAAWQRSLKAIANLSKPPRGNWNVIVHHATFSLLFSIRIRCTVWVFSRLARL
jgi:hypothetical protein